MGRKAQRRALDVWMNGERVGQWEVARGEHLFDYDSGWLGSAHARPLSLSMPLRPPGEPYRTEVVQPFFDNLLPDSDELRRRMMARFGTASTGPLDLLSEVGRDCVGAIQLLPPGSARPDVRRIEGRVVTPTQIAQQLAAVRSPTLGVQDKEDFRISLAGAQEKSAFLKHRGRWMVPEGATPTTHIFKLPISAEGDSDLDLSTSVENEWLCGQLLPRLGVPCASSEIATFKGQKVLIVERFDRALSADGKWLMRLPQEDLAQATKTPPGRKYERDGGPGIVTVMDLLHGSSNAAADREDFFRTQFVFWLLCAIDGHAKNFSIFIEPLGRFRLTPRYDVLSAYPVLGRKQNQLSPHKVKMAMAVEGKNRHYKWKEIRVAHWLETGRRCGLPESGGAILKDVLARVPDAIAKAKKRLPKDFPTSVSKPIFDGLASAARDAQQALLP